MKKWLIFAVFFVAMLLGYFQMSGNVVDGPEFVGPSSEQIACMQECAGCNYGSDECSYEDYERCNAKCGVDPETSGPPEPADEDEACMQNCILVGCEAHDLECQDGNMAKCEIECDMIKEPEAKNKEEQCIRDCVDEKDPEIRCEPGTSYGAGEQGNKICQECAEECEHLYDGPCLTDEKWRQKEQECNSQGEHVDGEPVYGNSGEGYECVVDLECVDYSSEFGDEPGEGPGIGQEGYVALNPVAQGVDNLIKFVKGLFGGGDSEEVEEGNNNLEE